MHSYGSKLAPLTRDMPLLPHPSPITPACHILHRPLCYTVSSQIARFKEF